MSLCVCVCGAVARMEGELNDIEALKDLKVELLSQKEVSCCYLSMKNMLNSLENVLSSSLASS